MMFLLQGLYGVGWMKDDNEWWTEKCFEADNCSLF